MAKQTISFVATEELAEWIEDEADRRMTTKSSAAQQLLAEKYRAEQGDRDRDPEPDQSDKGGSEQADTGKPEWVENLMQKHSDHWYRPDSEEYDYAIKTPEGDRKYRKTPEAVGRMLNKHYE